MGCTINVQIELRKKFNFKNKVSRFSKMILNIDLKFLINQLEIVI